jgi:hypothetical protein
VAAGREPEVPLEQCTARTQLGDEVFQVFISAMTARATATGSGASVIGRPMTM